MKPIGDVSIVSDMDRAIVLMHEAGQWLEATGKNPSKWWQPANLNKEFLLQYVKPDEFYVALVEGIPAAAAAFQFSQSSQDWGAVDGDTPHPALYIHWLCVSRSFAGKGMPGILIHFAEKLAREHSTALIRVDTDADEPSLRRMYESYEFVLQKVLDESYRKSALYQKQL